MIKLLGKDVIEKFKPELKEQVNVMRTLGKNPKLIIFSNPDDTASTIYIENKIKLANELGILIEEKQIGRDTREIDFINEVKRAGFDDSIHGIIVQLPINEKFNNEKILQAIPAHKDVDGLTYQNLGMTLANSNEFHLKPCTPKGIVTLLEKNQVVDRFLTLEAKNLVVFGRSNLVGLPVSIMLMNKYHLTLTIFHSKSDIDWGIVDNADLIISATGQREWIETSMIKNSHKKVFVDVGIHRNENGKVTGDIKVDSEVFAITPVPGGVGPMTVFSLMTNVLNACQYSCSHG